MCGKREWARAEEVLKKIADVNGKAADVENMGADSAEKMSVKGSDQPLRTWNYYKIITHPKLRLRVLIFSIIKLYLCMSFYGCIFALSSLGGNIYVNSCIVALAEGLGTTLSCKISFIIQKFNFFISQSTFIPNQEVIKRKPSSCCGHWC